MDARKEIERLLQEHGAKLLRDDNHLVYDISGIGTGESTRFTLSKTPSDWRSDHNSLSTLRRLLGVKNGHVELTEAGTGTFGEVLNAALNLEDQALKLLETVEAPVQESSALRLRLDARIAELESGKKSVQKQIAGLHTEIAGFDQQLEKMAKLLCLCDDADMESTLSDLLSPMKKKIGRPRTLTTPHRKEPRQPVQCGVCDKVFTGPPAMSNRRRHMKVFHPTKEQTVAESVGFIGSAVQVTRSRVLAATQTFDSDVAFTTREVINLMVGDQKLNAVEQSRVESAVSKWMFVLRDAGQVTEEVKGAGRRSTSWSKVDLTKLDRREVTERWAR